MPGLKDLPRAHFGGLAVQPADMANAERRKFRDIEVSFDTGEQTTHKVYFTNAVTILGYRVFVTKALAITDAGTITFRNAAGTNMTTNNPASLAASSAVGTEVNGSLGFTANNTIAGGTHMELVVAKTTAGGKARVMIEYRAD